MILHNCQLLKQETITDTIVRMTLDAPELARSAEPGQFVNVRVGNSIDPLLRRPFSIHRINRKQGAIDLLYRIIGRGTELMRSAENGCRFDVLGPLGQSFDLKKPVDHALVVAGGLGCAPVFFLIDELIRKKSAVTLLWGARIAEEIFNLPEFETRGVVVKTATENGTSGIRGFVTELLENVLQEPDHPQFSRGFVCGPEPMLKRVKEITRRFSFPWQASLEKNMACGIGVCQGCAVRKETGALAMVCSDGPVFNLEEMVFEG